MQKRFYSLLLAISALFPVMLFAQAVNTTSQVTWAFDLGTASQTATYSGTTSSYFNPDYFSVGSNLTLLDKYTQSGTTSGTLTCTRFQPKTSASGASDADAVSFHIRPKTGLSFKPSTISFYAMRYGTDGGTMVVKWVDKDGVVTTIKDPFSPVRNNNTTTSHLVSIDVSTMNLSAVEDAKLQIIVYGLGATKQFGISNLNVSGTLEGTLVNVASYNLTTSVSPASAGSVANVPGGSVFDEGKDVVLTATRNFAYAFSHWADENDQQLSTENPYTVKMTGHKTVKAVFNSIATYELKVNTDGGGKDYMISYSPAPTMVDSKKMYETGTVVTMTASSNPVMLFTNWSTGATSTDLVTTMDANKEITASYSASDYVVGWDFYKAGGSGRVADFYSSTDNETAALNIRKADGTVSSWLDKSQVAAGGYEGRPGAVNWKPLADKYYYQISFNAANYKDMSVRSAMLLNYNGYSVQRVEYSTNGTDFTLLDTIGIKNTKVWFDKTLTLPAAANNAATVYIRWIPDYTSSLLGAEALNNDGTALSTIYVYGTTAFVNDGVAPVLVSSVPAASGTGASATGKIVLTFDEKVQLANGTTATVGSKTLTPVLAGKTLTFSYTGLEYNTAYTFTLPANTVSDMGGNTLTSAVSFGFTTMTRLVVTKRSFDFVVGVDGDFKAAIDAATAASSSGKRFYIFFPNGEYNIGASTGDANQKTSLTLANVSYVGQSTNNVILYNKNTTEGISTTATINFTNTANNIYMQDLTLRNKDFRSGANGAFASIGRCVALQDYGTRNIYKNVNVQSNQDTYYSGNGRLYFENSALHGTVDFLCGGGDVVFNECLLYLEDRSGNCITAPATASSWGYVFLDCTIDGYASTDGNYNLGRPWQNSPRSVYINTKMAVKPTALGWTEMGVVPGLFAEYNSTTPAGTAIDVSGRKKSFTYSGVTTAVNPYLSAQDAANYTVDNILGGVDAWQPQLYTDQAAAPVISVNGSEISWANNDYVLCWAVFKDNVFVKFVTANSYSVPQNTTNGSVFTVRAANEMGGLGAASNAISYTATGLKDVNAGKVVLSQSFTSVDGKKMSTLKGYTGFVIVRTVYTDGTVNSTKIFRTED